MSLNFSTFLPLMWDPQHLVILRASTVYYGDSFTFSYVDDDVCTSQQRTYGPPRPATGMVLYLCM
jgi:hypothetical protein